MLYSLLDSIRKNGENVANTYEKGLQLQQIAKRESIGFESDNEISQLLAEINTIIQLSDVEINKAINTNGKANKAKCFNSCLLELITIKGMVAILTINPTTKKIMLDPPRPKHISPKSSKITKTTMASLLFTYFFKDSMQQLYATLEKVHIRKLFLIQ